MNCPPLETLRYLLLDRLDAKEVERIDDHLLHCESCRNVFAELERTEVDPIDVEIKEALANNSLDKYISSQNHPDVAGFRITKKIGSGGTGIVYEAVDATTGEVKALKVLRSAHHFDPVALRRFEKEREAVARLEHKNIVRFFHCDNPHCIVMERLEGKNLGDIGVPLSVKEASNIILQVIEGIEHAHRNNIVHRDIKPSNIFRCHDGTIKILDLGLAKILSPDHGTSTGTTDHIVGTLDFLSPEQILAPDEVGVQSDIYSLGVLFFFLLTGTLPFGGSPGAKLAGHARDQAPNVRKLRTEVPPALAKIVSKMLEKDTNRRFQSMSAVGNAIELSRSPKSFSRFTRLSWALLIGFFAIVSIAGFSIINPRDITAFPTHPALSAIVDEFERDYARAESRYAKNSIIVSGTVNEIDQEENGVYLATDHATVYLVCQFDKKRFDVTNLQEGDAIAIHGFCHGTNRVGELSLIMMSDCAIVENAPH